MTEETPRTLVLTGHFPPSTGGVQRFTWELVRRLPADRVVVVAPHTRGDAAFDRGLPFPVVRRPGYLLSLDLARIVAEHGCTAAWIPAAAPIGLFAPSLRRAGIDWIVASTHGQEIGWLRAAPTRGGLRQIASSVDVLTYLTGWSHDLLSKELAGPMARLVGGVDCTVFSPGERRQRLRPQVISVARLVRRKGQDNLLRAWPMVLAEQPDALLTIVGTGPYARALEQLAGRLRLGDSVHFRGRISQREQVAALRGSDVLVTPSRDDRHGLQTEGLALTTLEGSAVGLPVVVSRSGGSGESLVDGKTGYLVETGPEALAAPILALLGDPEHARALGLAGRAWVRQSFGWERSADRLRGLLASGATRD
jgi:phosphatidylinositol alpha-1,6-mannosyltransferase